MCILPHQNKENWLSAHRPACVRNRTASVISSTLEISYHTLLSQFHLLIRAYSIFIFIFLLIFTNKNHLTETHLFISHEFSVNQTLNQWKHHFDGFKFSDEYETCKDLRFFRNHKRQDLPKIKCLHRKLLFPI